MAHLKIFSKLSKPTSFFNKNWLKNMKLNIDAISTKYHKIKIRLSIDFYQQFQLLSFLYLTKKQQCLQISASSYGLWNFCTAVWWRNLLSLMKMFKQFLLGISQIFVSPTFQVGVFHEILKSILSFNLLSFWLMQRKCFVEVTHHQGVQKIKSKIK